MDENEVDEPIEDTEVSTETVEQPASYDDSAMQEKLDGIISRLDDLQKTIALFVSNGGAVINDSDDDGEPDVIDLDDDGDAIPDVMDLDLSI